MKCRTNSLFVILMAGCCAGWLSCADAIAQEEFLPPPDEASMGPAASEPYYAEMPNANLADGAPMLGAPCLECAPTAGYGCCDCYRPCVKPPFWEAHASAVIMHRELLSEVDLVTANTGLANQRPLLRSADFETQWEVGADVSVMLNDFWGGMVELRTFWIDDFSDYIRATGDDMSINTAVPTVIGFDNPQQLASLYATEFASVELNYRERFSHCVTVIAGFRYINLHERLDIDIEGAAGSDLYTTWFSNNDAFGAQLGLEFQVWKDCSSPWEVRGKALFAGFYNDSRGQFSFYTDNLAPNLAGQGSDKGPSGDGVFLGEFGLTAYYHLSANASLHVGYDLLYLDGVVLASELPSTTAQFPQERVPMILNSGTVIFQGAVLGVDFRY